VFGLGRSGNSAHALNGDGEMVMTQLQLEGKDLEEAIDEIVDETIALDFVNEETIDPTVDIDVESNLEQLKTQTRSAVQTRVNNAFTGAMLQVTTQTRVYTQDELDEATAKDTTPLKLRLANQAMIGNDDLLEEEALELDMKELLNKAKKGATQMKQIAATLGAAFLEERQAIQDEYRDQILSLKDAIATAIANSEDPSELEDQLEALRDDMREEIQAIVQTYKQQTVQARETWQNEANVRKGGTSSSQTNSQHQSSTTAG
jgi:hypothetical protein